MGNVKYSYKVQYRLKSDDADLPKREICLPEMEAGWEALFWQNMGYRGTKEEVDSDSVVCENLD